MIINTLKELFKRDLKKLANEIESYQDESKMWEVSNDIKNSGGNLCLHIIGNLNAYIGIGLAKTDYIRNRELEFAAKNIAKEKLLMDIMNTSTVVLKGLDQVAEDDLSIDFPIKIWDKETKMLFTLLHLHSHLNYHLGQINYHRRLKDEI